MKKFIVFLLALILIIAMTVPASAEGPAGTAPAQQLTQAVTGQLIDIAKELVAVIVIAIFGYIGLCIKQLFKKYINTDIKSAVVQDAVRFVEQVYKDIHGPDKYNRALLYIENILEEKGIDFSAEEMEAMIEAAVLEMNKAIKDTPAA